MDKKKFYSRIAIFAFFYLLFMFVPGDFGMDGYWANGIEQLAERYRISSDQMAYHNLNNVSIFEDLLFILSIVVFLLSPVLVLVCALCYKNEGLRNWLWLAFLMPLWWLCVDGRLLVFEVFFTTGTFLAIACIALILWSIYEILKPGFMFLTGKRQ